MKRVYAKIFDQVFDSSIASDYHVRHFFMDMIVLASADGVVDMTPDAIARKTNIPLRLVTRFLVKLSEPDPLSRSKENEGRRIVLIDSQRSWGWLIVNFEHYRSLRTDGDRRSYFRDYRRTRRAEGKDKPPKKSTGVQNENVNGSPESQTFTQAEAEAEAEEKSGECELPGIPVVSAKPWPGETPPPPKGRRNGTHATPVETAVRRIFPNADSDICRQIAEAGRRKVPAATDDEIAIAVHRAYDEDRGSQKGPALFLTTVPKKIAEVIRHTRPQHEWPSVEVRP
jgi:hypothetical protein